MMLLADSCVLQDTVDAPADETTATICESGRQAGLGARVVFKGGPSHKRYVSRLSERQIPDDELSEMHLQTCSP